MPRSDVAASGTPDVPAENHEGAARPTPASAEAWAPRLFAAIQANDSTGVLDLFFPGAAFDIVKAMREPGRYHRRLVAFYIEDLAIEHERYSDVPELRYERFEMGRCTWQAVRSEGNRVPYWSCRHNWLQTRSEHRVRRYEIRVMINWGPNWYITHLGPIRR